MLVSVEIKNGIIQTDLSFIQDGQYLLKIIPLHNKTLKEFYAWYFTLIEDYCINTGNSKYQIHEHFKKEQGITSIKEIPLEDWSAVIETLKYYLLNNS